jgi:hypothetical protein
MNPKSARVILDDKTQFYKSYAKFFVHTVADIADLKSKPEVVRRLLENPSGKIVFKAADGKCGVGVEILKTADFTADSIAAFMEKTNLTSWRNLSSNTLNCKRFLRRQSIPLGFLRSSTIGIRLSFGQPTADFCKFSG